MPLDQVFADWPISNDPAVHIGAIEKLLDSGVTIVDINSGQPDQQKVIAFHQSSVLPKFVSRS